MPYHKNGVPDEITREIATGQPDIPVSFARTIIRNLMEGGVSLEEIGLLTNPTFAAPVAAQIKKLVRSFESMATVQAAAIYASGVGPAEFFISQEKKIFLRNVLLTRELVMQEEGRFNISEAARRLGSSRSSFRRFCKQWDLT